MPECPSDADLSKFLNESLPPDRAGMLSAHVDSCSHCQVRLDKLTEGSDGAAARYKDLSSLISSERRWGLNRGSDGTARIEPAPDAATQIIGGATSPPPPLRFTGLPAVPGFDVVAEIGRGGMGVVTRRGTGG